MRINTMKSIFNYLCIPFVFCLPGYALGSSSAGMFSLNNTDFVVLLSFLVFVGVLIYFGVPGIISKFLDKRAADIGSEINEASKILEDAKTLLSSLEEEHKKNGLSIKQMIENAKSKAKSEEDKSKKYIEDLIKARISSAEEQVQSSERKIITEIKDTAINMGFRKARARLDKELTEENYRLHFDQSMKMVKGTLTKIK
ncbi:hypothetical protein CBE37_00515 [bacterium TMED277]|nr:MAG: hypothetical protein CBE37_00515 [bacterium TMED277]